MKYIVNISTVVMKKLLCILLFFFCLISCDDSRQQKIACLLQEWTGKEIIFPSNSITMLLKTDTIPFSKPKTQYVIVSYIDSIGCTNCKLRLPVWEAFINQLYSICPGKVSTLLFLHPKDREELIHILERDKFSYPICIDEKDSFNKLNQFPTDMIFQTFLLDENNKVLAIGSPIHNPKIRELYLNIIQGAKVTVDGKENAVQAEVSLDKTTMHFGRFDWKEEQNDTFILKNVGNHLLIIQDVTTSCGCTQVTYSKEPVLPGDSVSLHVTYKADHPEHFDKTITVYCNAKPSPVILRITGDAE